MADSSSMLESLERARAELKRLEDCREKYTGNNPNKYRSAIDRTRSIISVLESQLERQN